MNRKWHVVSRDWFGDLRRKTQWKGQVCLRCYKRGADSFFQKAKISLCSALGEDPWVYQKWRKETAALRKQWRPEQPPLQIPGPLSPGMKRKILQLCPEPVGPALDVGAAPCYLSGTERVPASGVTLHSWRVNSCPSVIPKRSSLVLDF